jgi:carboxymethylenebutenolidase
MRRERRRFLVRLGAALTFAPLAACRSPARSAEYGALHSYVARPHDTEAKRAPVVLVLPGEHGIDAHIQSAAKRAAQAGFLAIAPDLCALEDSEARVGQLLALVDDVAARPESGDLGAIGYSSGGTLALRLAARSQKLAAVVAYYAPLPPVLEVPRIKARLLLHFAQADADINTGVPAYEAALNAAGVGNAIHVYAGTAHGFAEESDASRYRSEAAALAWERTVAFLRDALA